MALMRFATLALMLALSAPVVSAQQPPKDDFSLGAPPRTISESEAGLQSQLERIFDLEKKGNGKEVEAALNELEIPDDAGWFTQVFGPELGPKMAATYKVGWDNFRDSVSSQFRPNAEDRNIRVKSNELSGSSSRFTSKNAASITSSMKTPASLYEACVEGDAGRCRPFLGVFTYVRGAFRLLSWQTLYLLPNIRPMRIRVGGNVALTNLISKVTPTYPPEAKKKGLVGTVMLHAIIAVDGTVQQLEVANPDKVDPLLSQAAMDAVKQWRYKPTLLNGDPVEVDTTISVVFTLGNR